MQRQQAMCEIFWAIGGSLLCVVVSFYYCKLNDPKRLFSHYNSVQKDFSSPQTWCLYYAGFESMRNDGAWSYWVKKGSETKEKSNKKEEEPKEDVISRLYPTEGYYSSRNKTVIRKHMQWLSDASVDAIIIPWYARHVDANFPSRRRVTDKSLSKIIGVAEGTDIKVGIMIPDYEGRTWETMLADIKNFISLYGGRSCVLKTNRRPVVFIENAQKLNGTMYQLLRVRRTHLDCYYVGQMNTKDEFLVGIQEGYDALTTLYADEGASWAANTEHWNEMKNLFDQRAMEMIPAVAPGTFNIKRDAGRYYGMRWEKAINTNSAIVLINSFNGWHEGTNIEPAMSTSGHKLDDDNWSGENSVAFIQITNKWSTKLKAK